MEGKISVYLAFFSLCVIVAAFFVPVFNTQAYFGSSIGGLTPFGGMVQSMKVCTCSATILLTVGDPKGGDFMVTPATILYANFNFTPGRWVLGLAAPVSLACMVYKGNSCVQEGSGKPILIMGTS